jgi:hypothetical protein
MKLRKIKELLSSGKKENKQIFSFSYNKYNQLMMQ